MDNYGFSDAADPFVFVSDYTAALVFGRKQSILPSQLWIASLLPAMTPGVQSVNQPGARRLLQRGGERAILLAAGAGERCDPA